MLHSPKIMGSMLTRNPEQHSAVVSKWLRAHGHDEIAEKVDTLGAKYSSPQSQSDAPEIVNPAMQRVTDHAKRILSDAEGLTPDEQAECWDVYYAARSSAELAAKLQPMDIPNEVKHQLMVAFQQHREIAKSKTLKDRIDNAVAVVHRVAQLHKTSAPEGGSALDKAERHPVILKLITDAVTKEREKKEE